MFFKYIHCYKHNYVNEIEILYLVKKSKSVLKNLSITIIEI